MASTTTDRRFGVNSGVAVKAPCKAATTANITLSGEQTIDGISCTDGDRVLVWQQTNGVQNGIWVVDTGSWSRAKDANGFYDLVEGTIVPVNRGSAYEGYVFRLSTTGTIIPGTTSLTFELFPGLSLSTRNNFSTVELMKAATNLANNTIVSTDEHTLGNGYSGGNHYLIRAVTGATGGNGYIIKLDNGAQEAVGIFPNGYIIDKQFGIDPDGATDQTSAYDEIKSANLGLDLVVSTGTTYFSGTYNLSGLPRLRPQEGAIFSVANSIGIDYPDLTLTSKLSITNRGKSKTVIYPANDSVDYVAHTTLDAGKYDTLTALDFDSDASAAEVNLSNSTYDNTPTSSATLTATKATLANSWSSPLSNGVSFTTEVGAYFELSFFSNQAKSNSNIIMVLHDGGQDYAGVRVNDRDSSFSTHAYQIDLVTGTSAGQTKESSIDAGNRLYNNDDQTSVLIGLEIVTQQKVNCYANHRLFGSAELPEGVFGQHIFVGAEALYSASSSTLDNLVKYTGKTTKAHPITKRVAFFGDSLTFGSTNTLPWPKLIKSAAERLPGVGSLQFDDDDNYAVSGDTAAEQETVMDGVTLSNYDIVCVLVGTNDAAQGIAQSAFLTALNDMYTQISAASAKMVIGLPPMFGSSGGPRLGLIWSTIQRFAADNSDVYVADPLTTLSDEYQYMVGDELHPDMFGSARIAAAFAQSIEQAINSPTQGNQVNLSDAYSIGDNTVTAGSALPTSGQRKAGDYHRNNSPVNIGGGSYIVGWYRATTGSAHVIGTDWIVDAINDSASETAANIASVSATVNTAGKYEGKKIWDSTNNREMRASGSGAADAWHVIDGSATVTPS